MNEDNNRTIAFPDDDSDLKFFIKELAKYKIFIFFTTSILTSLFVIFSFIQPDIYKSSALLKVNSDSSSSSSMLNSYQGIASLAGISMPSGRGVEKSEYAIQIIQSRSFMNHLIASYDIKKDILASKSFDHIKNQTIYDETFDIDAKSNLDIHDIFLKNIISISKSKENFITISASHLSPIFANYLLNIVVKELNQTVKNKDLRDSSEAMSYLNELLPETKVQDVKKSINNLIEKQLEVMMLSSIKSDYVLEYVDPPFIPQSPDGPKRILIIIIGLFFSFFMAITLTSGYILNKKS